MVMMKTMTAARVTAKNEAMNDCKYNGYCLRMAYRQQQHQDLADLGERRSLLDREKMEDGRAQTQLNQYMRLWDKDW